jgi:hypothetical protein
MFAPRVNNDPSKLTNKGDAFLDAAFLVGLGFGLFALPRLGSAFDSESFFLGT